MIRALVDFALNNRFVVIAVMVLLTLWGVVSFHNLPVEAYPDIADNYVTVITQWPGRSAEEVEQQVTIPVEIQMNGIPHLSYLRSESIFGLSFVIMIFDDSSDNDWNRQKVLERLTQVSLPPGLQPQIGTDWSTVGQIYWYTLRSTNPKYDLMELRSIEDWTLLKEFKSVPNVVDVSDFGGTVREYQVRVDPAKLVSYGLSIGQAEQQLANNNINAGGSFVEVGLQQMNVRTLGLFQSVRDIQQTMLKTQTGTAIRVGDIADVVQGPKIRLGHMARANHMEDGRIIDEPDVIQGVVLLRKGADAGPTLEAIHKKVDQLNNGILPDGVKVVPMLDRADLLHYTLHTVLHNLGEGMILVVIVLLLFLGNVRAALIVALTIPFSLLFASICLDLRKIPANLLSLGAIDFGIIVNGSIVLMEVILARYEQDPNKVLDEAGTLKAVLEVAKPMFFATLIIITAYLPLFAFESVEKKLFAPMAFAVGFSLLGGLSFALAAIPAMTFVAYRKPGQIWQNPVFGWLHKKYYAQLLQIIRRPKIALYPGIIAAVIAVILALTVGREFLPYLDEGSIWVQIEMPPGISIQKATDMARNYRQVVRTFPEVSYVVTQTGRNDDGTDPFTFSHIESSIGLKPYGEWGGDKQALIARLSNKLKQECPGMSFGFTQPMIDGVYDMIAGAHSELVVKVFGDDLDESRRISADIVNVLNSVKGAADVAVDQEPPLPQLQIKVNRESASRYGINVADVDDLIETAIGGKALSSVFVGDKSYDVNVRFIESARDNPQAISDLTISSPNGGRIPLSDIAEIKVGPGESTIAREMSRRYTTVRLDLRGRALSSFLAEAQRGIESKVKYDHEKFEIVWGGQFENEQRAQSRLAIIIPAVLGLIFLILFAAFGKGRFASIIMLTVPLALLGGFAALHLRGMTLNVSSAVGFIALFGVAVQNGVIMVSNLNRWRASGAPLSSAVLRGASERLRPVLMTAAVAILGLLPAALSHSVGSDVQRPLATVIVGGLITATALTLLVLPAVYYVTEKRVETKESTASSQNESPKP